MSKSSEVSSSMFVGVCTAVLALIVVREAWNLPSAFYDPLGPAGLVIASAAIVFVLSILLVLRSAIWFRSAPVSAGEVVRAAAATWPALLIAAAFLVYLIVLNARLFGLRESTLALFLVTSLVFKLPERTDLNARYLLSVLGVGVLVSYGSYWLFTEIFIVNLPR